MSISTEKTNVLDRTNLTVVPEGTGEKEYFVGCYTKEDWEHIHKVLLEDGTLEDNIPPGAKVCEYECGHSDTRASYMLDDAEAAALRNHPRVKYVNLNYDTYAGTFHPDPDDLNCNVQRLPRFQKNVLNYRAFNTAPATPSRNRVSLGSSDLNRTGYQLLRHTQKENPWDATGAEYAGGTRSGADHQILERDIYQLGDGTGVDAIVNDDGFFIAHPEFVNCSTDPVGYQTGNVLTWSGISTTPGTCGVLDLVLDAPYYIDPDFFNASPSTRLTQRWDGTTVPVESAARSWWSDSNQRSAGFSTIGTVSGISTSYTRAYCNGSNIDRPTNNSNHGTQCAGQVFGKNYGVAYNCNKWVLNGIGNGNAGINGGIFDVQKLFHLYKPNYDRHSANNGNQQNPDKNPTLSANSWGYRSTSHDSGGYYWYRPEVLDGSIEGTGYTGGSGEPAFFEIVGQEGDGGRMKGEMVDSSVTQAGLELAEAGVIWVVAAGNSGQTQTRPEDPDFNSYWATTSQGNSVALSNATHTEFGLTCYNTINRRGWPQSLGKTTSGLSTAGTEYPAINVGALDDQISLGGRSTNSPVNPTINNTDYKECIVSYSDRGTGIDVYGAADDTITADGYQFRTTSTAWEHPEQYTGLTEPALDIDFGGTSSACPTVSGWLTTKLQYNRGWTWRDIKAWLQNSCGTQDPSRFYYGPDVTGISSTNTSWDDFHSLNMYGQGPVVIWDAPTGSPTEPQRPELTFGSE